MLTHIEARNFKRFEHLDLELGSPVVFIGPNNSGKTSAMQALALWRHGLSLWHAKYPKGRAPKRRPGVTVSRQDLISIPVPAVNYLWHHQHLRSRSTKSDNTARTDNVRIEIIVDGTSGGRTWRCGLEFDYANQDWIYCRPLRKDSDSLPERMPVPKEALNVRISALPPMSGLSATETRLDKGAIDVRIGEGRTAEVLRNLCHIVHTSEQSVHWNSVVVWIRDLFGCDLEAPEYVPSRGEILLFYRERGSRFDISSAGRGMHQTLLLLAYMYANPSSVILLDKPDAHLEILRQRQTYRILTDVASSQGSQIIAASHSEVLLNEAARRDMVVAFVGVPHRIDQSSSSAVRKALGEIGFDDYVQAQQTGWILYLEGSTDLAILQSFAKRLGHKEALLALRSPFVRYVGNQPRAVERHFFAIREAVPHLRGLALFDRLDRELSDQDRLKLLQWRRREIENYLSSLPTLLRFATSTAERESPTSLLTRPEIERRREAMMTAVRTVSSALQTLDKGSPWSDDTKASDEVLAPVFQNYYRNLGLPNLMAKKSFYELAEHLPESEIAEEVREKLDAIARVARSGVE